MQAVNRMHSQQQMAWNQHLQTQAMMNMLSLRDRAQAVQSVPYDFNIVYKDSTIERAFTKIDFNEGIHTLTLGRKKEKRDVFPHQTRYISRTVNGRELKGIPNDSCWLFQTTRGRINAYSFVAEPDTPGILLVQKGDRGEMLLYKPENVEALVADNEKALKAVRRKKYFKAIQIYNE